MSTQPLFRYLTPERPRSRRSDPQSSVRAERQMRNSGAMRGQALIALNLVKQYPGKSSKELAQLGTLDRYQLARRLPELREATLIWRFEQAEGDVLWYPVEAGL